MNRVRLSALMLLVSAPALAEAGLPNSFCAQQSCGCGPTTTCTCGQVCNSNQGVCTVAQAGFCTNDAQCLGPCGNFICDGNICVPGVRPDAGAAPVVGGGVWDGGFPGSDGGTDPAPPPTGCAAVPVLGLVAAAAWLRARRGR